ncbi:hypothetical protein, partial [Enterococcus faecium]|uniref:hypothetical protein n=1 Tax=Enterococcus faecium TaxID=1352 RepID=UPI003DA0E964
MSAAAWKDLETWRRLAMKAVKKGNPASFTFTTTAIPTAVYQTIAGGLQAAHDSETVARVFDAVERGEEVARPDEVK